MKKFVLSLALLCGCVFGAQAQLLYKVSRDSSNVKPSYIVAASRLVNPMGTITQVSELRNAMNNTDQMFFEVNKGAYANSLNDAKLLESGKTLLGLLTPAQQTKLNAFLKKYMEVDFRSSYVQKKYGNLTPAALLEDLEQLLFVANHMGEYDPTHTFDQYFEAQAKANNEPIGGLSEIDDYINVTYKTDLKQQVSQLMGFLENENVELSKLNKSVDAYSAQDIDAVRKASADRVNQALLTTWTTKMQTVMAEKPTFFVIDAANLGGEDGILLQLRQAGYIVEGLK